MEDTVNCDIILKARNIQQTNDALIKNPKILAFDIEVSSTLGTPNPKEDPIVMVAFYGNEGYSKVITWKSFSQPKKHVEFVSDEAELIIRFKDTITEYKPDYIVGYFSDGFDFPYLRDRAEKYKIKLALGLDGKPIKFSKRTDINTTRIKGIAHIDIYKFIVRAMRDTLDVESFDLDTVATKLLGEGKADIPITELHHAWESNDQEKIRAYCDYNLQDAKITYRLTNLMLPQLNEFVKVVGLPIDEVSRMSFGQLIENYLMRRVQEFNEIIPNKPDYAEKKRRATESYEGGYVYEPQPGTYNDIIVFDFKSLFPTIISAHNICVSTITLNQVDSIPSPDILVNRKLTRYYFSHAKEGFMPVIIKDILTRRNRIKEIMKKDEKKDPVLDARQYSLKILANSFYGYLGFSAARWYNNACAASITAYARQYIKNVITKVKENGFNVIYGDTDSVFFSLGNKTKKDALLFLQEINRELPSLMELEFENYYPRGIFVMKKGDEKGAKKKYALIDEQGKIKVTGFESIRGDWSVIAKEVQKKVFEIILKDNDIPGALTYTQQIIKQVYAKEIPLEKMIIKKRLKKDISDYENIGPHVEVAKRLQQRGEKVTIGTKIAYIINEGKGIVRERARLLDETESYDSEYYVKNQILPAVAKIFEVLGYDEKSLIMQEQSSLSDFSKK